MSLPRLPDPVPSAVPVFAPNPPPNPHSGAHPHLSCPACDLARTVVAAVNASGH